MVSIKFLYIISTVICFASTACAVRCKVCNSQLTSDCDDPFRAGERYDSECDTFGEIFKLVNSYVPNVKFEQPSATGCFKLKYKNEGDGKIHTNRLCYYGQGSHITNFCKEYNAGSMQSPLVKQLSCDFCTGDLCNSSTTTGIMAATLLLLVVLVRLMA